MSDSVGNFKNIDSTRAEQIFSGNTKRFYTDYLLPNCDENNDGILSQDEIDKNFIDTSLFDADAGELFVRDASINFINDKNLEEDFTSETILDTYYAIFEEESEGYSKDDKYEARGDEETLEKFENETKAALEYYSARYPNLEKYFDDISEYQFINSKSPTDIENSDAPYTTRRALMYTINSAGAYSPRTNEITVLTNVEDIDRPESEYKENFKYGSHKEISDSLGLRQLLAHELGHSLDCATVDENGNVTFDPDKKDTNFGGFSESEVFTSAFTKDMKKSKLEGKSQDDIIADKASFKGGYARGQIAYAATTFQKGNPHEAFAVIVEAILNKDYEYVETIYNTFPNAVKAAEKYLKSIE